jgi:WD40 repeat protein/serine/threonine protein kinase
MNEHDAEPADRTDERWIDALAEYDESLASGNAGTNGQVDVHVVGGELAREIECLQLLEQIWPRGKQRWESLEQKSEGQDYHAATDRPASFGRFEIRRPLGYGAHGIVFLAYDPVLRREVALKVPRPDAIMTDELRQRFLREAQAAAALDHPHVVPIHEAGHVGAACYLVEAYCRGPSLAGWLKERGEPLPADEAATLVAILADGVAHAHARGILHRDLKPSNILLDCPPKEVPGVGCQVSGRCFENAGALAGPRLGAVSGDPRTTLGFVPKISDFGLAKFSDGGREHTASGTLIGTVGYMAPEQAAGCANKVGPQADVYSLGAVLYELLTGRMPFLGETPLSVLQQVQFAEPIQPRRLRSSIPRDLETLCLKCLEKRPRDRYQTAAALAADLRRFLRREPIEARPISAPQRTWRWCRRNPSLAGATGAAALGLILFAVVSASFAWYQTRANERLELGARQLEAEKQQTQAALERAEQHYVAAQRQSTFSALDRGLSLCEQGDVARGMLWLARSLTMASVASELPDENRNELEHAIRSNLAAWHAELHPLRTLIPHEADVESLAFSPDCTMLMTDEADGNVKLWDVHTGRQVVPALRHPANVLCAAFSPCGNVVLTGCADGMARIWTITTGELVGEPLLHSSAVYAVAFNDDGSRVFTGTDPELRVWDTTTRRVVQGPLVQPPGAVLTARFLPGSRRLVTGSWDHRARLWDVEEGKLIAELSHDGPVCSFDVSPDRSLIVTASHDHTAHFWNAHTGASVGSPLNHPDQVMTVAFAQDGQSVITLCSDQKLRVWEVQSGEITARPLSLPNETVQFTAAVSDDTGLIATAGRGEDVRLWNRKRGQNDFLAKEVAWKDANSIFAENSSDPFFEHADAVRDVECSPDGQYILTGCMDYAARLWNLAAGRQVGPSLMHEARVLDVAFSPSGNVLLTCSADRTARLWDAASGKTLVSPLMHPDKVNSVAFHPDGRTVITGCEDGVVRFWNVGDGQLLSDRMLRHGSAIQGLSFTPDGSLIIVSEKNCAVRVWDAHSAVELPGHMPHPGNVLKMAVSPDGRTVLSGSNDATARLWNLATREQMGASLPHCSSLHGVAFSPDGRLALSGSNDRTARLWDVASQRPIGPPIFHDHKVSAVAFATIGNRFFTGTRAGRVHVWNLASPVDDEPAVVERLVEVLTGLELDDNGASRSINFRRWHERRAQIGSSQVFSPH